MTRLSLLLITLVVSLSVAALHIVGETYFFYWTYWWYDILVHGLGGVAVGSLFASIYHAHGALVLPRFVFIIGATLLIGLLWEVFEYIIKSHQYEVWDPYFLDTIMDLGMDMAGGMLAFVFSRKML